MEKFFSLKNAKKCDKMAIQKPKGTVPYGHREMPSDNFDAPCSAVFPTKNVYVSCYF